MPADVPPEDAVPGDAVPGDAVPAGLLAEMRALRGRARTARHAYWFPLVLFGVLTCASIPFYIQPPGNTDSAGGLPYLGGFSPFVSHAVAYYWLGALIGGLVITQVWYLWHARRVGLQTPSSAYLATTFLLTAMAASIPLLAQIRSPRSLRFLGQLQRLYPGDLTIRGTFPFVLIAAGLLVLAWAERSRVLTAIAVLYAGSAVLSSLYDVENLTQRLGWNPSPGDQALPNILLPGLLLLVTGAATVAAQRLRKPTA
jgi:hypothetical protein